MCLLTLGSKTAAAVALIMTLMLGVALAQAKLPWRPDSLITLTAEEEDIKFVLRTILRSNRIVAIFKGAIEGTVDLDEEDVPAQGIFNKLITEFELQYSYDEDTRTATIQPKRVASVTPKAAAPVRDFVVPQYANFTEIQAVLEKFGLGSEGITYHINSGTISLFGMASRIQDIKLLIQQLEKSAKSRQVQEATRLASEREAADARRSEEEERKKTEEEARRRAEEEAARKLTEKEAKVAAPVQDFVVPQYVNFTVIQAVLEKFGLGSEGITYDINSGTISLIGMASRIQDIKLLIQQLEKSAESRQKRELIDRRSEYEGRLYQELLSAKVKVIPLRYASVSETTKTFQGKSISVPGIEETLQAILGVQINKSGDSAQNQNGLVISGSRNVSTGGNPDLESSEHSALYRLKQLTRPSISVDRRTNSVIVRGSELAIKEVEEVIRQLDQPQKMLEIKVIILTASKGVTEQLGVDYRALRRTQNNKKGFGVDTGTSGGLAATTSAASDAVTLLPQVIAADLLGSFIVATNDNFLQVQLAALSADDKSQIIASPKVITLDNVSASITRSRSVFAQVAASGDAGQDLKEIQTGLRIDILPTVVPSDIAGQEQLVRLSFNATNSAPTQANFGQIEVTAQEIQTEVLIPDGGTYVVGGLFDDARAENVSGLPLLRELPIIGQLFRTNVSTDALAETIFLITPRIVQPDDLLSKDIAARVGTREYMKRQQSVLEQMKSNIANPKDTFPHALRHLVEDE